MSAVLSRLAPRRRAATEREAPRSWRSAAGSARPAAGARRARRLARAATSASCTSRAVRRRFSAACRSAASACRSRSTTVASQRRRSRALRRRRRRSTKQALRDARLVQGRDVRIKILGDGELKKKLTVSAHAFSASAAEKIEKAGGKVVVLAAARRSAADEARGASRGSSMAAFEGFSNIGKVPELRRRIVFTLAIIAIYRVGVFITTPGVDRSVMQNIVQRPGRPARPLQPVLGRRAREPLDLRARHHAVHLGEHHHAAHGHGE